MKDFRKGLSQTYLFVFWKMVGRVVVETSLEALQ